MGKYDGPSFYKKDHPTVEPMHGKRREKFVSKHELPDSVQTRGEIEKEAHQYMETPSYLNRRFRSTKIPNSLQHLDGWKNSRRNHQLIQAISERLDIASSDYLLFEEYLKEKPKQRPGPELELLMEPVTAAGDESDNKADDELEETSEAKDEREAEETAKDQMDGETTVQPESKTEPPHNPFTQSSDGVTLVRNNLVDLQFGPKKTSSVKKKTADKKPVRKKATPVKKKSAVPVKQEKSTPVKQASTVPVKQKKTITGKRRKVKVVKGKMLAQKHKPNSGLHRSLSSIIADDKQAMKQWNSNLDSLFSAQKNSEK